MIGIKTFPKGLESREETHTIKCKNSLLLSHEETSSLVKCKQAELASQREAASQEKALKTSPRLIALQRLPALLGDQKKQEKTFKSSPSLFTGSWLK